MLRPIPLLLALLLVCPVAAYSAPKSAPKSAPVAKAQQEDIVTIQAKLDAFAKDFVDRASIYVRPSRSEPQVEKQSAKLVVARYVEIDPSTLRTELIASQQVDFTYIAKLIYVEHIYECQAASPKEALAGPFQRVKSRRLTELPRYMKGKWVN